MRQLLALGAVNLMCTLEDGRQAHWLLDLERIARTSHAVAEAPTEHFQFVAVSAGGRQSSAEEGSQAREQSCETGSPGVMISILCCGVEANRRYHSANERIRTVLESLPAVSALNPYPPPLAHVDRQLTWRNWGRSVACSPGRIYSDHAKPGGLQQAPFRSPRTKQDCQEILAYAREHGLQVRVFGACHSWAPLSCTGQVRAGQLNLCQLFNDRARVECSCGVSLCLCASRCDAV